MITNSHAGTRVDEVAAGLYRISTPFDVVPGGFTQNSFLLSGDEPLLFHAGYRSLSPLTLEAIGHVIDVSQLRWIGGSHFEADEYGALNELLAAAPAATPFGSAIGVMTSLDDFASRAPRSLTDGEVFSLGHRRLQWLDTPHVPHGWDCGVLFDHTTGTLLCGDLFAQPGSRPEPVTESEILTSSESLRGMLDYYAHATRTHSLLERLAMLKPTLLACQHGSSYRGDGAALLRELSRVLRDAGDATPEA